MIGRAFLFKGSSKEEGLQRVEAAYLKTQKSVSWDAATGVAGASSQKRACAACPMKKKISPQTAAGPVLGHADFDEMPSI